jgi:hypothetical protein
VLLGGEKGLPLLEEEAFTVSGPVGLLSHSVIVSSGQVLHDVQSRCGTFVQDGLKGIKGLEMSTDNYYIWGALEGCCSRFHGIPYVLAETHLEQRSQYPVHTAAFGHDGK